MVFDPGYLRLGVRFWRMHQSGSTQTFKAASSSSIRDMPFVRIDKDRPFCSGLMDFTLWMAQRGIFAGSARKAYVAQACKQTMQENILGWSTGAARNGAWAGQAEGLSYSR